MQFENDITYCLKVLQEGGLILYPTDTVWGIGCDATNDEAVAKIYALKKRQESKSMIVLVGEDQDISKYTQQPSIKVYDYIKGLQKPVTVIYQNAFNLSRNIINEDGSIGIRVVNEKFCKTLLQQFGKPIVSTSANISGFPTPLIFSDIDLLIKKGVDYIVQYRLEESAPAQPSAIIKINDDGSYTIIRP